MTTTDIEKSEPGDDEPGKDLVPAASAADDALTEPLTALLEPATSSRKEAVRTRILLPLLLPILSAAALAFFALNLSRVLLAGGSTGSLIIASIVSLLVLGGAAWISAQPRLSTGTLALVLVGFLGLIGAMGLTTLGPSEPHEEEAAAGWVRPAGDPVGTLDVTAEANLKFNADAFNAPEGIVQINYILGGGNHTLVFVEPQFKGFELVVSPAQAEDSDKVELAAGKYTIYCSVPGHRAAGMEATVTVP